MTSNLLLSFPGASASAVIGAPPSEIWELISDPRNHPMIAGSGEVMWVRMRDQAEPQQGAIFESFQRMHGIRYTTANRIVAWEPPTFFAWRIGFSFAPGIAQTWFFHLQPVGRETRVTNGVANVWAMPNLPPFTLARHLAGVIEANNCAPTLRRIAFMLDAGPLRDLERSYTAPEEAFAYLPPADLFAPLWLGAAALAVGVGLRARRGQA